ncbi:D-glucuronyl c5-epimerase [Plakobranchus ocellatus]|uniref:heparosan-N-sulfate-glucuronate 5-epimerase n=1 Tax=Plakobranchus ocellatus TaxID=259542 RepID=A0AAV4DEH2_9GAST|nr:D-glucuronyl c5-epimerase [Plakobranchus ocellatus]
MRTVRRQLRRGDSCFRALVLMIVSVCAATMGAWVWGSGALLFKKRLVIEMSHHQLSLNGPGASDGVQTPPASAVQSREAIVTTSNKVCPPCPDAKPPPPSVLPMASDPKGMNCSVNGDYLIGCRKDGDEVFMPASFVKKFFDKGVYEFRYSYGSVHPPTPVYEPGGAFLNFYRYFVEVRGMLLCTTASEGVPLAIQWDPAGYFYPITVAQFGLAHHAKGIVNGNPEPKVLSSGDLGPAGWKLPQDGSGSIKVVEEQVKGVTRKVLAFNAPESMTGEGPTFVINSEELALCVSIKMTSPGGGLTIKVKTKKFPVAYLHFTHEDTYMRVDGAHITLGMKQKNFGKWMRLTRDLDVDIIKGFNSAKDHLKQTIEVLEVTLHGRGFIDNMTVAATAHNENLMHAADWLVENQDQKGGWPTSSALDNFEMQLPPGWYSAMGQGQGMSALVRAYNLTGDRKYLESAEKALYLYTVSKIPIGILHLKLGSEEGGVRARFLGQLDWYEEYPTVPTSSFVLNGFIFSMMGLYDVMKTSEGEPQRLAEKLWDSGMRSLKFMLGMYDTGAGTLYDLRHVINHEPPNRARWDYHVTHIALIHEMAIVDGDPIFWEAWARWKGYLKGIRSHHN